MQSETSVTLETLASDLETVKNNLVTVVAELKDQKESLSRMRFEFEVAQRAADRIVNLAFALVASGTVALILSALRLYLPNPPA
ncbi:hypothetical protein GlitD10_0018 [Gloeomargarita lithophora Alchichica-D10]|uniref:Uncharacterized protein n=1 Tax=Gloeomargarita lithophora Alchichica-D10 TaxID=1188229 RepID=A0A1J0A8S1_9CYAN|nr:hypothetical protein [Gloeomargarita lithophora]APB32319.1 hypothetical protein GlitD10_0018 [Gloeomargarita lithophora Alchichica-D10]